MKKTLILVCLIFSVQSYSQITNDTDQVAQTLLKYVEGSSYSKLELIKSAFTEDATLYLSGRDGFKRYTTEEYANFFQNRKAGEFNGRYGKVLSIEMVKDIAMAKVEIAIPKVNMVYIDLFLLKKLDGTWKIISKTATRVDDGQ